MKYPMLNKKSITFRVRKARTKFHVYMCVYTFLGCILGKKKPGMIKSKPTKSSYSSDAEGNRAAKIRIATKLMCYIF